MSKRIKLLFASVVLALGFLFCVVGVSVNAETEPVVDEQQEVVENTEQQETEQPTEEQEEVVEDKDILEIAKVVFEFIKNTDINSLKTWFYSLCAALGIDLTLLGFLIIYLIQLKVKQFKNSESWQELKAKLDVKHQQELEAQAKQFNDTLEEMKQELLNQYRSLDEEKKKVAANNIAVLKDNLNDIKEDLEK